MNFTDYTYDIPGLIGAAIIIVAYLLLQMNKLEANGAPYLIMNILGSFLIIASLIFSWNLSAFIIEIFWLLISIYGMIKYLIRTKHQP